MHAALRPLLAASLLACGYTPLRPDAGGPTPTLSLGTFTDVSPAGDLGLEVEHVVRARLAGRSRPRVERRGPRLSGHVVVGEDSALTSGEGGVAGSFAVEVTVTATLGADDALLWASGPVRRRGVYVRGPTPFESQSARRAAIVEAVGRAAHSVVDRLLAASEVPHG